MTNYIKVEVLDFAVEFVFGDIGELRTKWLPRSVIRTRPFLLARILSFCRYKSFYVGTGGDNFIKQLNHWLFQADL